MLRLLLGLIVLVFFSRWGPTVICVSTICVFLCFNGVEFGFQKIRAIIEGDYISNRLVFLRLWVVLMCFIASQSVKNFKIKEKFFVFFIISLLVFLVLRFSFNNYLLFYLSFECSIIPIMFLILG
jgi:NADH:ubiquinone oxidoreductase subunit 4 (subunit M)